MSRVPWASPTSILGALAAAALLAAPAVAAPVRLSDEHPLLSLAARGDSAYAVVGTEGLRPALVRSTGAGRSVLGTFGPGGLKHPVVAADADGVAVGWGRQISGGLEALSQRAAPFGEVRSHGLATGPMRLGLQNGLSLMAFPDRLGDAVVSAAGPEGEPERISLSSTGPDRRHLPLGLAFSGRDSYVLDLIQTPSRSELRVLGPENPPGALYAAADVRGLRGALAVERRRVYVAYRDGDGIVLATSALGSEIGWSRRELPATRDAEGSPSIIRSGGRTYIAYARRAAGHLDVYVATVDGSRIRAERITDSRDQDADPLLAAGEDGDVFVGWTRREKRPTRFSALLEQLR
jgi:hypothetical protein